MSDTTRKITAPIPDVESRPYWDAANQGRLLIKYCAACRRYHHYPRTLCPFCFSDQTEWREAAGTGTIYSHSTMRRAPMPFTIAYVTLAEGPNMLTNLVDCDPDTIRIGQTVRVVFKEAEGGQKVPMFTV